MSFKPELPGSAPLSDIVKSEGTAGKIFGLYFFNSLFIFLVFILGTKIAVIPHTNAV